MSDRVQSATDDLRAFLFENIYLSKSVKSDAEQAKFLLETLYRYYLHDIYRLPREHLALYQEEDEVDENLMVTDYIAGMTDRYAVRVFEEHFMPKGWSY